MRAAIASGHPLVSQAGARMLTRGGNAIDAAVAAGFCANVVELGLTSLAGAGFALVQPAAGAPLLYDFCSDTPSGSVSETTEFYPVTITFKEAAQTVQVGWGSVAVPGVLKGLLQLHQAHGCLPLIEVISPAIEVAAGHAVLPYQREVLELLSPILRSTPESKRHYFDGEVLKQHYANPALEQFLRRLPDEGDESFYRGAIAERWLETAEGGLITEQDLRDYQVIVRSPLQQDYRGYQLLTNPPPSFGGGLLGLALAHAATELDTRRFGSVEHLTSLQTLMQHVDTLRAQGVLMPESWRVQQQRGTTHISVCDAQGNAVSMTSSTGETAGCLVPGTGIMLNNLLGEEDLFPEGFHRYHPRTRVASMMAPSMLSRDGVLQWVLGSGGSKRIRTALMQVMSNLVDFKMDIETATHAPRAHWDGETMQLEPGFHALAHYQQQARCPTNLWQARSMYFGGVHSVSPQGYAAGDPRRSGACLVL